MNQNLIEVGEIALSEVETLGATQAEVYIESSRILSFSVENGKLTVTNQKIDMGCGMRSVIGNRVGYAYVTSIDKDDVRETAEDSIHVAKAAIPDVNFETLPSYTGSYQKIKGIFDKNFEAVTPEDGIQLLMSGVNACLDASGKERNVIEAVFELEIRARAIVNSLGISSSYNSTTAEMAIAATLGSGPDKVSSWDVQYSCNLDGIDPEWLGRQATERALNLRGAKKLDDGDMTLVLAPSAMDGIFGVGLTNAINARLVRDDRSFIPDSLDKIVASDVLEIRDDALMAAGIKSRPFDTEGVPSSCTDVISKGILKSYLHDSYTSNLAETKNTANAFRKSYENVPIISTSNLVISSGKGSLDDLVSEVSKGLLCLNSIDRPNEVTGELSAMAMEGFYIIDGTIQHPVKSTLFATTMQDLMLNTFRVGDDVRMTESIVSPSIIIDSVKVTSG